MNLGYKRILFSSKLSSEICVTSGEKVCFYGYLVLFNIMQHVFIFDINLITCTFQNASLINDSII